MCKYYKWPMENAADDKIAVGDAFFVYQNWRRVAYRAIISTWTEIH